MTSAIAVSPVVERLSHTTAPARPARPAATSRSGRALARDRRARRATPRGEMRTRRSDTIAAPTASARTAEATVAAQPIDRRRSDG